MGGETKEKCTRVPAGEGGPALSPEELKEAPETLLIEADLKKVIEYEDKSAIRVQCAPEVVKIKAEPYYVPLELVLPYPVDRGQVTSSLSAQGTLSICLRVDKIWRSDGPDEGSNPWLLAKALRSNDEGGDDNNESSPTAPEIQLQGGSGSGPVREEEELPEDRFHRKDLISQHILEQKRQETEQRRKEKEKERGDRKKEVADKKKAAADAGKTWAEMYPGEPEVVFMDPDELTKSNGGSTTTDKDGKAEDKTLFGNYTPSEAAIKAAQAWEKRLFSSGPGQIKAAAVPSSSEQTEPVSAPLSSISSREGGTNQDESHSSQSNQGKLPKSALLAFELV